jgi:hypothetical protein
VPQAPEFDGDVQASACGQHPVLAPSAGSVCLGQSLGCRKSAFSGP